MRLARHITRSIGDLMWNTKGDGIPWSGTRGGDTQPPDPTVRITGADTPAIVGATGTVRGTTNGAGITAVSVAFDAAPGAGSVMASPVGGSFSSWTARIPYPASPGPHTIQTIAKNSSKSSGVATFAVTTTNDPGFRILSPSAGQTTSSGTVELAVSCPDPNSQIEYSLDGSSTWMPLPPPLNLRWTAEVVIPSAGLDAGQPVSHSIAVRQVRAGSPPTAAFTVTISAIDSAPPLLQLDQPQDQLEIRSQLVEPVGQVAGIVVQGHAQDDSSNGSLTSGLQRVEVSSDGGASWVQVTPDTDGNWSHTFRNQQPGIYQVAARALDKFSNMTRVDRGVSIRDAGALTDVSPHAYLRALIDYTCSRVQRPGGGLITPGLLDGVFRQPFSALTSSGPLDSEAPVSAIRLTCATLRDFITPTASPALGHWPLTGSALADLGRDVSSSPPLTLTATSGVRPLADPEHGQVADFDGTGTMSVVTRNTARPARDPLYLTGAFTLSAWVRPTSLPTTTFVGIISRGDNYKLGISDSGYLTYFLPVPPPPPPMMLRVSGWRQTSFKPQLNTWTHLAFVFEQPNGNVLLYVNGQLVPEPENQYAIPLSDDSYSVDQFVLGEGGFKGQLSDIRVHGYALAPAEIAAIARQLFTKPVLFASEPTPGVQVDNPQGWTWQADTAAPGGNRLTTPVTPASSTYTLREASLPWPLVSRGEALSAWVRIDPSTPPSVLSISWRDESGDDATAWHTATWSSDPAATGPLPPAGRWARLSVAANQLGMAGRMQTGLRLSVTGGAGTSWALITKDDWRTAGAGPIRDYLLAAYESLLVSAGTSFTELRLTRSQPDSAARRALADRLGIDLTDPDKVGSRPDRLDLLLLTPDPGASTALQPLTEDQLATLFGLPSLITAPDTASNAVAEPLLLTWRRSRLYTQWLAADSATPVLDPDIVTAADIRTRVVGDPAYDLWRARRSWLDDQYQALQTRLFSTTNSDELAAAITQAVDGTNLIDLDYTRRTGADIIETLNKLAVDLPGFTQLVQVLHLAANSDVEVLPEEVTDVAAILAARFKRHLGYPTWVAEETAFATTHGPLLSPAWFTVPTPGTPSPVPPLWRGTAQQRQTWERTLQARAQQEDTLITQLQNAYLAADEAGLPTLRDFLISAAATSNPATAEGQLSQRLLIDLRPTGQTTATQRAVETLQSLLGAARTQAFTAPILDGELGATPTGWSLDVPADPSLKTPPPGPELFDQEWAWMGTYSAWTSAQWVFLYPDAILLPSLLPPPPATNAFTTLIADLRAASPVSASDALRIAEKYRQAAVPQASDPAIADPGWLAPGGDLAGLRNLSATWFPPSTSPTNLWVLPATDPNPTDPKSTRLELLYYVPMQIGRALHQAGDYATALDWYRRVYTFTEAPAQRAIGDWLTQPDSSSFSNTDTWLQTSLNPHDLAAERYRAHLRYTITAIAHCLLDFADSEFAANTTDALPPARLLYLDALEALDQLAAASDPTPGAPPDLTGPLLRRRAEINLAKLRNGRDIAGVTRTLELFAPPATPTVTSNGAVRPPTPVTQPGPYRYSTLITRAQQLTATAGQLEAAYLAALKDHDTAGYTAARAQQDLSVASAMLTVHNDQVTEAQANAQLANDQLTRAQTQYNTYDTWLAQGPNAYEQDQLNSIAQASSIQHDITDSDMGIQIAQAAMSVASATTFPNPVAGAAAAISAGAIALLAINKASLTKQLTNLQAQAQSDALQASWQRRADEWTLARALANADTTLARDQQQIAGDRVTSSQDELAVATQQQANAQATVNYLATQFASAELFEWMAQVLSQSYRALLQQATATAQQAQAALIFERQDPSIQFIQADYWTAPPPDAAQPGASSSQPDRKGLTGSARLLADLTALDQHAFTTDRRRLQLTQAISLAQASPVDFQRFRDTGVLPFTTTNAWFDRAFPGHYMRTIDKVRVTVVGLIPTLTGIRATLTASGLSRIVTAGDRFPSTVIRRNPDTIAFTCPSNATGLALELDPQAQLLKPFEGMGIESNWELRMPKAANPIDYAQLADVIISFDYTALDSDDYRTQVLRTLDTETRAQLTLSLARDVPDAFYSLINSGPTDALTAAFPVDTTYLPPNLTSPRLEGVAVYFVTTSTLTDEIEIAGLDLTVGTTTINVGPTKTQGWIASTNSIASWSVNLLSHSPPASPAGNWTLTLQDSPAIHNALEAGEITDIVLSLSYAATLPSWPS